MKLDREDDGREMNSNGGATFTTSTPLAGNAL